MKNVMKIFISLSIMLSVFHLQSIDVEASSKAETMIQIALNETGSGYKSKYGARPWCASFVSWAARSAGISTSIIPATSSTSEMYSKVKNNGGQVVSSPQRGDLVFYKKKNGAICHVAIMTSSTMSIHGNYSNKVKHIVADSYIDSNGAKTSRNRMIFVRPNYGSSDAISNDKIENNNTVNNSTTKPTVNNTATTVKKTNVSKLTIKGISSKVDYTSKQIKPSITVYNGSKKVATSNYTVTYGKNTDPGKATVTLKGKEDYEGTVTKTFTILPVDYTKLNEAKAAVPADLSIYTDESISTLNKELDKAKALKKTSIQKTVDNVTSELNKAISGLVVKTADYTCVEEAKAGIPEDLSDYTKASVDALNVAINAIEEGKLITEQQMVNDMALAIETAVNNLEINYLRAEVVLPVTAVIGACFAGIYFYKKKKYINIDVVEE